MGNAQQMDNAMLVLANKAAADLKMLFMRLRYKINDGHGPSDNLTFAHRRH